MAKPSEGKMNAVYYSLRLVTGILDPSVHPWKPSGRTPLHDTEILVQQHAGCNCHILEYKASIWNLANGEALEEPGTSFIDLDEANSPYKNNSEPPPISKTRTGSPSQLQRLQLVGYSTGSDQQDTPQMKSPYTNIAGSISKAPTTEMMVQSQMTAVTPMAHHS